MESSFLIINWIMINYTLFWATIHFSLNSHFGICCLVIIHLMILVEDESDLLQTDEK